MLHTYSLSHLERLPHAKLPEHAQPHGLGVQKVVTLKGLQRLKVCAVIPEVGHPLAAHCVVVGVALWGTHRQKHKTHDVTFCLL